MTRGPGPASVRVLHLVTRAGPAAEAAALLARSGRGALALGPGDGTLAEEGAAGRASSGAIVVPHLGREVSLWRDVLAFCEIVALLARLRPGTLHTHTSKAGFLGRWAAWLLNRTSLRSRPITVVHTPHGHLLYGYFGPLGSAFFRVLEAATARVTDRLVAVSDGERRESLAAGLGEPGQWSVIPAGALLDPKASALSPRERRRLRERLGLPREAFVVGTVARLEPVKGVRHLVEAAAMLVRKGGGEGFGDQPSRVRFLVVGDGSLRARLERLAGDLGIGPSVVFAGFREDAASCLDAMDVYVQPSLNEAMGQALLQALSRGVPVVASAVCGIPDVIEDGVSGLLVPPGEPAAIASAVGRILADPCLGQRLGAGGRASALRDDGRGGLLFGPERAGRLHEEHYAGLSGRTAERP
ncbi:MAG: glycosyltransferase [Elusimicrobiota bacterium]|jgi:glycosyltransferase involved in cell wall biosynthesis